MGGRLANLHQWVEPADIELGSAGPGDTGRAVGRPALFDPGRHSLKTRKLNMFTLIAMGTGVAWVYSIVGTLLPGTFPAAMRGHDGSVAVYFEAAAVITVLVLLGQVLELRAREQTSGAIRALLDLSPKNGPPRQVWTARMRMSVLIR